MKFKKILSFVLAFIMIASVTASAETLEFTIGEKNAYESRDGQINSFTVENAPYTKNGRTMVPVRIIAEKFGATVEWLEHTHQVVISTSGKEITLSLGSDVAYVNGEKIMLDVAPEEFNGRTMVPIRFVSETLGKNVEYIESTEQVLITDDEAIMSVNGINVYYDDFLAALCIVGYTPDQEYLLPQYIDYVIEAFIELYGSSSYLRLTGVEPPETYSDEVKKAMSENFDFGGKTSLVAPVARFLAADYFLSDYIYTYCETEEALDVAYSLYQKDFITAKHILLLADDVNRETVKKEAEKILERINSGESFDALMNEFCEDPGLEQYPQGYTFTYNEMVPEFEKAAFGLKVGEISGVIETPYGFHIIKREPLEAAKPEMTRMLLEFLADNLYSQLVAQARDFSDYQIYVPREKIVELFK